jgi:hypothetical protein
LGIKPVEEPFLRLGIIATRIYFAWFTIILLTN